MKKTKKMQIDESNVAMVSTKIKSHKMKLKLLPIMRCNRLAAICMNIGAGLCSTLFVIVSSTATTPRKLYVGTSTRHAPREIILVAWVKTAKYRNVVCVLLATAVAALSHLQGACNSNKGAVTESVVHGFGHSTSADCPRALGALSILREQIHGAGLLLLYFFCGC